MRKNIISYFAAAVIMTAVCTVLTSFADSSEVYKRTPIGEFEIKQIPEGSILLVHSDREFYCNLSYLYSLLLQGVRKTSMPMTAPIRLCISPVSASYYIDTAQPVKETVINGIVISREKSYIAAALGGRDKVNKDTVEKAVASLKSRLAEHPEYRADGSPAVVVWDIATFNPERKNTFEIQIPVRKNKGETAMKMPELNPQENAVIVNKGTDAPFRGRYVETTSPGIYICRKCGAPLFRADDKFRSECGWPSFDDAISGQVDSKLDADGRRVEITCKSCQGHLGHVFAGERLTSKNTRHCVNSTSMVLEAPDSERVRRVMFAGGCFWGVEYWFRKEPGVLSVASGYSGGKKEFPSYKDVCGGKTGHLEVAEVIYDPSKVSFEKLARLFFEIHDPTQKGRQGPDIGEQYSSAIFYTTEEQKTTVEKLIAKLRQDGFDVVTEVRPASKFWQAEDYHQDYYARKGSMPYCHKYVKRFKEAPIPPDPDEKKN